MRYRISGNKNWLFISESKMPTTELSTTKTLMTANAVGPCANQSGHLLRVSIGHGELESAPVHQRLT